MFVTAEIRWFHPGPLPPDAEAWFGEVIAVACVEARTDRYLVPVADDCGEKLREGRAESKQRLATARPLVCGSAAGTPEVWSKTVVDDLPDRRSVEVAKRRRYGRVETRGGRCTLELAALDVAGEAWWTVGLEASGQGPGRRLPALREAAQRWLTHAAAPDLPAAAARAYPAWLRERCG